ncbi:MAG TPA: four helix bundle protein [Bacteroidales bacterium]|nr:four helix bundle protein [Bacteroidales bacterium]HRZ49335.1 four helix bundle protein [Bacteroidales bacterium]
MSKSILQEKSYLFALRIVKLFLHLKENKQYDIARQLLRSGTSIGANVEEGLGAQSRKDFYMKINIAHKESRETRYWIRLLKDSDILELKLADSLLHDCNELVKITASIIATMKKDAIPKSFPDQPIKP